MANNRELSQFGSFVEVSNSTVGITTSVGIAKTNPQYALDVEGDINFSGTFFQGGSQFIASRWTASGNNIYRPSGVGVNTSLVSSTLTVSGDARITGVTTSTGGFVGNLTGTATSSTNASSATYATTAGVATALQTARTFEITGDVVGSPVSFNGTGNVSIAATIQPNSVGLGTDTTGNYVATISGTSGKIDVSGSGNESAAVTISLPNEINLSGINATGVTTSTSYNVGTAAGITTSITTIATTTPTAIASISVTSYRSSKIQIQITQNTNYQASDVLLIHNGTTANIIEYGSIATNDYLGSFSCDVSGGNARLLINMISSSSATIKVLSQSLTI